MSAELAQNVATERIPYSERVHDYLQQIKSEARYRTFHEIDRKNAEYPLAYSFTYHKDVIVFCSTEYLGLSQHPQVISAINTALAKVGAGSGGSRNICGNSHYHVELEKELADWLAKGSALLFNSGYSANQAGLIALGSIFPDLVYLSDAKNHVSIVDGIRFSRKEKHVFKHNDLKSLRKILEKLPLNQPKCIVFESLYSMDGDIAPIAAICELSKKYDALTFIDEVHAIGMYGSTGAGLCQQLDLSEQVTIIQGTLGKAIGVAGGFLAGDSELIDLIRCVASGFIFTLSSPPCLSAGSLASIRIIRSDPTLRNKLHKNSDRLKTYLQRDGINFMPTESFIIPILVPGAERCREVAETLASRFGIYVQPINYPSVPKGSERLRVVATPQHSSEQLSYFSRCLKSIL